MKVDSLRIHVHLILKILSVWRIFIADPVISELNFLPSRELKNNNFQYPKSSWNKIFTVVENGKFKDKTIAIVPDINQK